MTATVPSLNTRSSAVSMNVLAYQAVPQLVGTGTQGARPKAFEIPNHGLQKLCKSLLQGRGSTLVARHAASDFFGRPMKEVLFHKLSTLHLPNLFTAAARKGYLKKKKTPSRALHPRIRCPCPSDLWLSPKTPPPLPTPLPRYPPPHRRWLAEASSPGRPNMAHKAQLFHPQHTNTSNL